MFSYIDVIKSSLQICTCQTNEEPSKYICLNIWFCLVYHHYQHILWVILSLSNFFYQLYSQFKQYSFFFYNLVTSRVNGEGIPDIIGNFPMNSPGSWMAFWVVDIWGGYCGRNSRQWYYVVLRQLLKPLYRQVPHLLFYFLFVCFVLFLFFVFCFFLELVFLQ